MEKRYRNKIIIIIIIIIINSYSISKFGLCHCDLAMLSRNGALSGMWKYIRLSACEMHYSLLIPLPAPPDRLVGLVVRHPPREQKISGSNLACARIFLGRVIPVT